MFRDERGVYWLVFDIDTAFHAAQSFSGIMTGLATFRISDDSAMEMTSLPLGCKRTSQVNGAQPQEQRL